MSQNNLKISDRKVAKNEILIAISFDAIDTFKMGYDAEESLLNAMFKLPNDKPFLLLKNMYVVCGSGNMKSCISKHHKRGMLNCTEEYRIEFGIPRPVLIFAKNDMEYRHMLKLVWQLIHNLDFE